MGDTAPATQAAPEMVEIQKNVLDEIIAKSMEPKLAQFALIPKTFEEAAKYASYIHKSQFSPKGFTEQDIFIAVQMGMEIGVKPMAALQGIAVINGRPTIWGDLALAVVQASGMLADFKESDQHKAGAAKCGSCTVLRKGDKEPHTVQFSEVDAKTAGLIGKAGPWSQYPGRMYQMRARAFALRDKFSDVLKGLSIREEVEDYPQTAAVLHETLKQPQRKSETTTAFDTAAATNTQTVQTPSSPAPERAGLVDPTTAGKWSGQLANIEKQEGVIENGPKKGQAYKLFYIHAKDGNKFATFSSTQAGVAEELLAEGAVAEIEYKPGKSCATVKDIAKAQGGEPSEDQG